MADERPFPYSAIRPRPLVKARTRRAELPAEAMQAAAEGVLVALGECPACGAKLDPPGECLFCEEKP